MARTGRPPRAQTALAEPVAFRQLRITFDPWNTGHTSVNVVTVDYRGDRRIVHRIGAIELPLGRQALAGLSASDVTHRLVALLHVWLGDNRPAAAASAASAPPLGARGGTVTSEWMQPTLNLDFRR